MEADRHYKFGHHIILVGHEGHPEVFGTIGQLPSGAVTLIETVDDVNALNLNQYDKIAYVTQTTLSVDDTADIVKALQNKFPHIVGPHKEDICYATTNRQDAVKKIAPTVDVMLVIGAPNSSNSNRLVEVALKYGCPHAYLVQRAADINWDWLKNEEGPIDLGLTAGASAPNELIQEVIKACGERFEVSVEEITIRDEDVYFKLPRVLTG